MWHRRGAGTHLSCNNHGRKVRRLVIKEANMIEREIRNYWPGRCFGCSQINEHGLKLRFWKTENGCYTRCAVPDHLCGIEGVVHGGILTLILEEVAQWTIISHFAKFGMTREISVRYLRPVPTNVEIIAEAQIAGKTDKDISFSSRITDANGRVLTESISSWIFAPPSAIAKATSVAESTLQHFLARYSEDLS